MTAKRFEVWKTIGSFQCWHIEDTINDKVVCDHIIHKYETDRLCSCLNELHEENEQLKQSFNEVLKDLESTTFDKELLEKENEQLKHELLCKQLDKAPTKPINCKCHYEVKE